MGYSIVNIPKRNGKSRRIYVPDKELRAQLRIWLPGLLRLQEQACQDWVHGFRQGRSCVTNALAHVGYEYSVSLDIRDFFDSIHRDCLKVWCFKELLDEATVDDHLVQGFSTSPVLSNLAMVAVDARIMGLLTHKLPQFCQRWVFTRYADDMTISWSGQEYPLLVADHIRNEVESAIDFVGLRLNHDKTHVQCAKGGRRRRIITGVGVGQTAIHVTRRVKRRLRAATHQRRQWSARGLREWSRLKLPQCYRRLVPQAAGYFQVVGERAFELET